LPACGNASDGTASPGAVARRRPCQRALADGAGALTAGESSPLPPRSAGVGGRMLLRPPELGLVGPTLWVLCEVSQWEPVNVAVNGSTRRPPITKAQPRGGRSLAGHSGPAPAPCLGPAGRWRTGFSWPAGFLRGHRSRGLPCGSVTCSDLQRSIRLATPSAAAGDSRHRRGQVRHRRSSPGSGPRARAASAAEAIQPDRSSPGHNCRRVSQAGSRREKNYLAASASHAHLGFPAEMTAAKRRADTRPSGGLYAIGRRISPGSFYGSNSPAAGTIVRASAMTFEARDQPDGPPGVLIRGAGAMLTRRLLP